MRRITQLRFEKVIFCLTMMADRMRVKTSCEDSKRAEVESGRYEFPQEKSRLFNPSMRPIKVDKRNIFGVKSAKGCLVVSLKR